MFLKPGDTIECIAPASKFNPDCLPLIQNLIESWGFKAKISAPFSEEEWLCTHSEKKRFEILQNALLDPSTNAIWGIHGGYGSGQLLPYLDAMTPPPRPKLLLGFSDLTMLHLFVNKKWNWPSLHTPSARGVALEKVSKASIENLRRWLLGTCDPLEITPLNHAPLPSSATIVGGNLSLVATSLGTPWQIETQNHLLFLEEIGEKAYRIDRMLNQLAQAKLFQNAQGVLLGDFLLRDAKDDPDIKKLLKKWTEQMECPVFSISAGHGFENLVVPLNFKIPLSPLR